MKRDVTAAMTLKVTSTADLVLSIACSWRAAPRN